MALRYVHLFTWVLPAACINQPLTGYSLFCKRTPAQSTCAARILQSLGPLFPSEPSAHRQRLGLRTAAGYLSSPLQYSRLVDVGAHLINYCNLKLALAAGNQLLLQENIG